MSSPNVKAKTCGVRVTVSETAGRRFSVDGCRAFTLVDGFIVGKTKANGQMMGYAVSVLTVALAHIDNANLQELDIISKAIEERRKRIAA